MSSTDLEAAALLLARLGVTPEQLLAAAPGRTDIPTFREYIDQLSTAVPASTRRAYATYWRRIVDDWGDRRINEPTPTEIQRLCESQRVHVVMRRNTRGGRSATEHLIAALRCLYRHAVADNLITERDNPAARVAKPRRLPSTRRAIPRPPPRRAFHGRRQHRRRPRPRRVDPAPTCRDSLPTRRRTRPPPARPRRQPVACPAPREGRHHSMATRLAQPDAPPARPCPRTRRRPERTTAPVPGRPSNHCPPLRLPLGPAPATTPMGRRTTSQHALAQAHDPHLGRTPPRLRRRPRIRRPHRQQ